MQKVLFLKGLPASGKSTYAFELMKKEPGKWKRINKDTLRAMIDGSEFSRKNEKVILDLRDALLLSLLKEGYSVIIDDTNFYSKHEEAVRQIVQIYTDDNPGKEVEIEIKLIDTPLEECIARDAKRTGREQVGEKVIRDMYKRYCAPRLASIVLNKLGIGDGGDAVLLAPQVDPSLPNAIICDLDGTLALLDGRSPYDWHLVGTDGINEHVASIIRTLAILHRLIIVSGRDEVCRKETMEWLDKHNIPYKNLVMRRHKDNRPDDEVKYEMYRDHILGKYNVQAVFDDRNKVVAMWRKIGLTCLQVAEGNF